MARGVRNRKEISTMRPTPTDLFIISFVPTVDETDGQPIYIADPFIIPHSLLKVLIIMPFEFSISLEDEPDQNRADPSPIVQLTFWDLLESSPKLKTAALFILYHDSELDEIGQAFQGYMNRYWGSSADPLLDSIYISRKLHSWLSSRVATLSIPPPQLRTALYNECLNFHKRAGIVGIDEHDEVQRPFFDRAVLQRRQQHQNKSKTKATVKSVINALEQEASRIASSLWTELMTAGKILYYPPDKSPVI